MTLTCVVSLEGKCHKAFLSGPKSEEEMRKWNSIEKYFRKFCKERKQKNGLVSRKSVRVKRKLWILVSHYGRFQGFVWRRMILYRKRNFLKKSEPIRRLRKILEKARGDGIQKEQKDRSLMEEGPLFFITGRKVKTMGVSGDRFADCWREYKHSFASFSLFLHDLHLLLMVEYLTELVC